MLCLNRDFVDHNFDFVTELCLGLDLDKKKKKKAEGMQHQNESTASKQTK